MPSNRVPRRFEDIIDNAQAIFRYTDGMDRAPSKKIRWSTTQSSAVLNGSAKRRQSSAKWPQIREDRIFEIVKTDLPGLCAAAEEALRSWTLSKEP